MIDDVDRFNKMPIVERISFVISALEDEITSDDNNIVMKEGMKSTITVLNIIKDGA